MQLQILSAVLQFCVVVGLWSIYVADWQLALANVAAMAIGYSWLCQIRAKQARTSVSSNHSTDKPSRSPPVGLQHTPSVEQREDVHRCNVDKRHPDSNALSGSTVAVAAAFLTAFADSHEPKAKPAVTTEITGKPSKQSVAHDAATSSSLHSQHAARRAVEVPQQPKARKSGLVRHGAVDASSEVVDPEAERAARRAEMELLELLDAEANAQQTRKKTTPLPTAPGGAKGEDLTDPVVTGPDASAESQGGAQPRKGQKQVPRPAEVKIESRRSNKKQVQRQADAKVDSRHHVKASDSATETNEAEAVVALAAATPQRTPEKSLHASSSSKKELRRQRAGQKRENFEDEEEEEEDDLQRDKSHQKDDALAAVLNAVAKSNALNSVRMTRAQSEALSSTTMGSSGSTSSLASPESIVANSEASSDTVLAEPSGADPRAATGSVGDCECIEERPESSNKIGELVDGWSTRDAAEGVESMDGEVADWVNRIHSVDDCFDFTNVQGTRYQEPHSHAQVRQSGEVTQCSAPALVTSQSDSNLASQQCVRKLFPAPSQPSLMKGEGVGLAAELRAIFPSASIHIGPPAEGSDIAGAATCPTASNTCPTPPLATTQTLTHTVHYSSNMSSISSAGVPNAGCIASVGVPNDIQSAAPVVCFPSHASCVSSVGPHNEFNARQHTVTQGAAQLNGFASLGQTAPAGLLGGAIGPASPLSVTNHWVGSSSPSVPAIGNHGGRCSSHGGGVGADGTASSKNPPLAAEVLFNLPTSASLGPTPTGALSVAQVEASTKASAWRAQLRRNGVQHLTEVEQALRRRDGGAPVGEQTPSENMCGISTYATRAGPDGTSQSERSNWQTEHFSEGVPQTRWMHDAMSGKHLNQEHLPGDMMLHQDIVSQPWSMQQQQHAELPFSATNTMDLMGVCGDPARDLLQGLTGGQEQMGAAEVWRDQSLLSAASAPPKLWENQAASLAPQQYAESHAQYQAAYDEMYKSMLVARLEAAVPESYED